MLVRGESWTGRVKVQPSQHLQDARPQMLLACDSCHAQPGDCTVRPP